MKEYDPNEIFYRGHLIRTYVTKIGEEERSYGSEIVLWVTETDSKGKAVGEAVETLDRIKRLIDLEPTLKTIDNILQLKKSPLTLKEFLIQIKNLLETDKLGFE